MCQPGDTGTIKDGGNYVCALLRETPKNILKFTLIIACQFIKKNWIYFSFAHKNNTTIKVKKGVLDMEEDKTVQKS